MSKKKVYISGPMTGIENNNFKKFFEMESVLKEMGYEPINPARVPEGLCYGSYIEIDKILVENCQSILLLDNWHESAGAVIELQHYLKYKKANHEELEIIMESNIMNEYIEKIKSREVPY
jgi:hypothetical protein